MTWLIGVAVGGGGALGSDGAGVAGSEAVLCSTWLGEGCTTWSGGAGRRNPICNKARFIR